MRLRLTFFMSILIAANGISQVINKRDSHHIDPGNPDALCTKATPAFGFNEIRSNAIRHDSTYEWTWNVDMATWEIKYREIYAYNGGLNPTGSKYDRYVGGAWGDYFRYTYSFDEKDRLTDYMEQYWGGNSWVNTFRETYTYDDQDDLVEQLTQMGDGSNWRNFHLILFTYDTAHNLLTQINRSWQNIAWVNSVYRINDYDEHNRIIQQLRQDWANGAWNNSFLYDYTYDTLSNLVEYYSWKWNNTWVTNYRNAYEYDENHNRLLLRRLTPAGGNFWLYDYQFTYTYDQFNNELTSTEQDFVSNEWVNVDQFVYEYDPGNHLISEVYREWADSTWVGADSAFYFYNEFISLVASANVSEVKVFPNPASEVLFLNGMPLEASVSSAVLYSADGRIVQVLPVTGDDFSEIPISHLLPGSYHLALKSDQGLFVARFVRL